MADPPPGLATDASVFAHAGLAFGGETLEPLAEVPLDEQQVLTLAQEMTGLSDWGDDQTFRIGLSVLLDSIETMAPSPRWRHSFRRQIVHLLNQRLRLREDESRHPEVLDELIERPVIIVGLPRTGTTLSHELLGLDPLARAPRNWEYAAPWPAPSQTTFETDPRIAEVNESWRAQREASPELEHMLPMDANMPSECNDSMMYHFAGPNFTAWMKVPEHRSWSVDVTAPGLYATHRRILQQLQWRGPGGRWTLKSPGFISDLDAILDTYPDACLIWTHRDPARTIASLASLIASLQNALLGEYPDPVELGRGVQRQWTVALARGLEQRQRDPRVERAVLDVAYRDLVADKSATVARIHEHFGLELSEEHIRRVDQLERSQPSSHFAKHTYTPDAFGVDVDVVRDELSDYYKRFGDLV
jgi:hypothetical protein